jgi:cyclohexanone monooxygenase
MADFDALIVGGGLAGLYAIHRLRELGMRVRAFEAGDGIGGTWFWNRYPGARCDIESLQYSYSFSEPLQQDWAWPERYSSQPEILRYIHHVADQFDLSRDVQLNTRIISAVFDDRSSCWTLTSEANEEFSSPICIMATGNLSTPRVPNFHGLDSFRGDWYHTGMWPQDSVDFSGLRVGIIGTGSSGIQSIPLIAAQAKHLHVFQRSANFSLPAHNRPMDPERERQHKARYPEHRRAAYDTPFGISGYPPPTKSALEASPEERRATFEARWADGGIVSFLYSYNDLLLNQEANDLASEFVREKIRAIVRDPATAELLCPDDHPIGSKRLCLDTNYYETYNRDNVSLVDIRRSPIEAITPDGIRTREREYALDAIVFATGFDAMTGALREIDIQGTRGVTLAERWQAGPRTYLGLMVADFPNMFMITGPGSPGVKSQMILSIEQHTDWIVDCLRYMSMRGVNRIEATQEAERRWTEHVHEVASATLYPLANSWYMGANVPGKARVFMPYVGGVHTYKRHCDEVARNGYEGFAMSNVGEAIATRD